MKAGLIVGNVKPNSRTLDAGLLVTERLTGIAPEVVIDAIDLGAGLLGWGDKNVATAIEAIRGCNILIFASPTYKATYTGLLKLVLDQLPQDGLKGIVAVPLMLGAAMNHALAPDLLLKPVLVELGAICPTKGLYLLDSDYATSPLLDGWLESAKPAVAALCSGVAQ